MPKIQEKQGGFLHSQKPGFAGFRYRYIGAKSPTAPPPLQSLPLRARRRVAGLQVAPAARGRTRMCDLKSNVDSFCKKKLSFKKNKEVFLKQQSPLENSASSYIIKICQVTLH